MEFSRLYCTAYNKSPPRTWKLRLLQIDTPLWTEFGTVFSDRSRAVTKTSTDDSWRRLRTRDHSQHRTEPLPVWRAAYKPRPRLIALSGAVRGHQLRGTVGLKNSIRLVSGAGQYCDRWVFSFSLLTVYRGNNCRYGVCVFSKSEMMFLMWNCVFEVNWIYFINYDY